MSTVSNQIITRWKAGLVANLTVFCLSDCSQKCGFIYLSIYLFICLFVYLFIYKFTKGRWVEKRTISLLQGLSTQKKKNPYTSGVHLMLNLLPVWGLKLLYLFTGRRSNLISWWNSGSTRSSWTLRHSVQCGERFCTAADTDFWRPSSEVPYDSCCIGWTVFCITTDMI